MSTVICKFNGNNQNVNCPVLINKSRWRCIPRLITPLSTCPSHYPPKFPINASQSPLQPSHLPCAHPTNHPPSSANQLSQPCLSSGGRLLSSSFSTCELVHLSSSSSSSAPALHPPLYTQSFHSHAFIWCLYTLNGINPHLLLGNGKTPRDSGGGELTYNILSHPFPPTTPLLWTSRQVVLSCSRYRFSAVPDRFVCGVGIDAAAVSLVRCSILTIRIGIEMATQLTGYKERECRLKIRPFFSHLYWTQQCQTHKLNESNNRSRRCITKQKVNGSRYNGT